MNRNFESVLQSLPEAIMLLDREGIIQYATPVAAAITGFSPVELENQSLALIYPNDNEEMRLNYELGIALKEGKVDAEGWIFKKDGTHSWCWMSLVPLYNDSKEHTGFTCILRDITERKTHEIQLKESEERFRLMVEGVRDYAIFMLDPQGYIITWNEGARRTKGYMAQEIIGKHFSTFYTAEDLKIKKPVWELEIALATGKYEEEGWRVRKNGSLFWANVMITALFNEQNKHIGFSKVTRDLTERKENEEALRQSEERYRLLVEQVTDYGIFMMDEKGRIVSWNEGAYRINGYTIEEILGKYFSIFYPQEDLIKDKPANELKKAREEGKYEEEGWRIRKNGERFWASVVITPIYNKKILIGYTKVTRDLTERKEAERALRESHDQYKSLARELRLINDELTYANQELEQFTSIVSHDLQEPVRTIKSFLQLIDLKLDEEQNTELKNYINKAINAAGRMSELIRNLLHYSQLGKGEMVEQEVKVNDIINETLQNLRSSIDAAKARVVIQSDVDIVQGDPVQLVQLLQNLVGNALKFSSKQNPEIIIKAYREEEMVKFAVSDNGIGIDQSDYDKVFEIFRRLNAKKDYPGTGIGLAICKKIVDRHRGRIWPESQKGTGTTFYFTLNEAPKDTESVS